MIMPDNVQVVTGNHNILAYRPQHGSGVDNAVVVPDLDGGWRATPQPPAFLATEFGFIERPAGAGAIADAVSDIGAPTQHRIFGHLRVGAHSGELPNRRGF